MLQTRRRAARLLQRPYTYQLRGYADSGPVNPADPSAGHYEPPTSYPIPENESIGKGLYVALAVFFGSFAVYKFSRSDSDPAAAGDPSKQPLITRLLHRFDYLKEQNELRNTLYTNAMIQVGHDTNLFHGSPRSQYIQPRSADVVFNGGSPWNVPAGSTVDLEHVRRHYQEEAARMEIEREERRERMARYAERYKEKGAYGQVPNAVSSVGEKVSEGK